MPCCCIKTLNLCNVPVCGSLVLDQLVGSGEGGDWTLKMDYFQTQIVLTQEQTAGESITFDVSSLNENFEFTGQIYDANGGLVSITVGEDVYDCIKFKTIMNVII